ncbi:hypothetical protein PGT21_005136 [Puccinia graminis f. sp. tritici]|uniref:Uncharacterized protein n=1 Tax=Puccinia graminis f. sp. tritici TaxID=56615 RepID=A0A5B0MXS2_PUCGR|nr:hypothetical protein PGT21_005136 [Puccinia graminis f. sp. tritici]KAA1081567.1 hypothetical protein PGTUg99_018134 [Puccinia graminis f. sp. tritici]
MSKEDPESVATVSLSAKPLWDPPIERLMLSSAKPPAGHCSLIDCPSLCRGNSWIKESWTVESG